MTTDPIRQWAERRRPRGFTLPDPPADQPARPAVESLTPGSQPADYVPPSIADQFADFVRESRNGVYGR